MPHLPNTIEQDFREGVLNAEKLISGLPGVKFGDCYPLRHSFAEGMYVREISVPKGHLVITKIHKLDHPCFILKGDCSVLTEDGVKRIRAPHYMITPAGTKRIVYVHEDTVWVTVHATKETDLEKIEEDVIAKTFDDVVPSIDAEYEITEFISDVIKQKEEIDASPSPA